MPVDILLSYAPADKEAAAQLERHMTPMERAGKIRLWHRGKVEEGEVETVFNQHMATAQIVILLVSPDLEIDRDGDITASLKQREQRGVRVIPVLLRSVDLKNVRYTSLKMIPDGQAISLRRDRDQAWVEVVQGIGRVVQSILDSGGDRPAAAPASSAQPPPAQGVTPPVQAGQPIKILFLAANPSDTTKLRLGEESREIERRIRSGDRRDSFVFDQAWAVTSGELTQTLLQRRPAIVHFSGHGSDEGQLILQDQAGNSAPVGKDALARLFRTFAQRGIRCVVMNACYSEIQAEGIVQSVDCVVGITKEILDTAALAFTAGFYTGLAGGETVQMAFDLGCLQIDLMGVAGADLPRLHTKAGVDPAQLRLL